MTDLGSVFCSEVRLTPVNTNVEGKLNIFRNFLPISSAAVSLQKVNFFLSYKNFQQYCLSVCLSESQCEDGGVRANTGSVPLVRKHERKKKIISARLETSNYENQAPVPLT